MNLHYFLILGLLPLVGSLKYEVSNITWCPEIKSRRAYSLNITSWIKDDEQKFVGSGHLNKDLDNDNTYEIDVQKVLTKKNVRLVSLKGKASCKTLIAQGGAAWIEVATESKIPEPSKCPIRKNDYSLEEPWTLNADKIPLLKMVPRGKFNIQVLSKDLKGNLDFCFRFNFQRF